MAYITLEQAKKHLNIESGYTEDDSYITSLIDIAESAVDQYCNDGLTGYSGNTLTIPLPVKQATLLLIAHYYVTRQIVSYGVPQEIPYGFKFLLDFYRIRTVV